MFNRLPGAMLSLGHTHQWRKGRNCSRVLSQHTAAVDHAKSQPVQSGPTGGRAATYQSTLALVHATWLAPGGEERDTRRYARHWE